jgi:hypothetical protein
MAIYFGDELRSSNAQYPIIDLSENTSKGVIFVDALTDVEDPDNEGQIHPSLVNKVFPGVLLVNKASGKVYIFTAQDDPVQAAKIVDISDGNSAYWKNVGDTPIFDSDLYVNIGEGRTFGKYDDGDQLAWTGRTALDALRDALTKYQVFANDDINFAGTAPNAASIFEYSTAERLDQSATINFQVRNRNRNTLSGANTNVVNKGVFKIEVKKNGSSLGSIRGNGAGSGWIKTGIFNAGSSNYDSAGATSIQTAIEAMNSFNATSPSPYVTVEFTDSDVDIAAYTGNSGAVYQNYVVEVTPAAESGSVLDGSSDHEPVITLTAGNDTKGSYKVNAYASPVTSLTVARTSPSNIVSGLTSNSVRVFGDVESSISFTVTNSAKSQDSSIDISSISIERFYNSLDGTSVSSYEKIHGVGGTGEAALAATQNDGLTNSATYTFNDSHVTADFGGSVSGKELGEVDLTTVGYRIIVTDNGTSATVGGDDKTGEIAVVLFQVPAFVGYGDTNPVNTPSGDLATALQNLMLQNVDSADHFSQDPQGDPVLVSVTSGTPVNSIDGNISGLSTPNGKYIYIAFPIESSTADEITGISDGALDIFSDFNDPGTTLGRGAPVTAGTPTPIPVSFKNSTTVNYRLYSAASAGDGTGFPYTTLVISN